MAFYIVQMILCSLVTLKPEDAFPIPNRQFTCEDKLENNEAPHQFRHVIIGGPPRTNLIEGWLNFVQEYNQIETLIINDCTIVDAALLNFKKYTELGRLQLSHLDLDKFDLAKLANNVRLSCLNLDNNPIATFENDAQITLTDLSLMNTSLIALPDPSLHITKHLETLNFTSKFIQISRKEACETYKKLLKFNGVPCAQMNTDSVSTRTTEPTTQKDHKPQTSSSCRPESMGISKTLLYAIIIYVCAQVISALPLSDSSTTNINTKSLHLESKSISTVDNDLLKSFPKLTYLHLNNNSLTTLNINTPNLHYINLDNNAIKHIQNEDFDGIPNIERVVLSGNNLRRIDWDLDSVLHRINEIDLSRNLALRSVHIKSKTLEILSLANDNIDDLELDTPSLTLLDFRNGYFSDGGLDAICRRYSRLNFNISHIQESDATAQFYDCQKVIENEEEAVTEDNAHDEVPEKMAGCEYSTLRVNIDDVVLSAESYNMLCWLSIIMAIMVIVLFIMLAYFIVKWKID